MDNAASINQQIDEAIKDLKGRGYGANWFPDSYGNRTCLNFSHFSFLEKHSLNIIQHYSASHDQLMRFFYDFLKGIFSFFETKY